MSFTALKAIIDSHPLTQQQAHLHVLNRQAMKLIADSLRPDTVAPLTGQVVTPAPTPEQIAILEAEYAALIVQLKALVASFEDNPSLGIASHPNPSIGS